MSERTFDRETLLDLTVNVIPLGIILFFVVVFLVSSTWEFDPFIMAISMGLLVVPFVALAFLTYVSGRAIARDEGKDESAATQELTASDAELEEVETDDTDDYTMAEDRLDTAEVDTADETDDQRSEEDESADSTTEETGG